MKNNRNIQMFKRCLILHLLFIFYAPNILASTSLETVGDIGQIALPLTAISVTLFNKDLKGFSEFAYSYLLSTGTVQLLKHTVPRKRPNNGNQSFPSGHTANGFVSASFLT